MKSVTAEEMRGIDEKAIQGYGIPSLLLMENAGRACAEEVLKLNPGAIRTVAVLSGKGNNGGDGFVAARHLHNRGIRCVVIFFQDPEEMKSDPLVNFKILEKMNVSLVDCSKDWNPKKVREILSKSDAVVDALFGTGLSKPVEDPFKSAIEWINESHLPVLAIDIPSGLNADSGEVMGVCVRATVTVTLGLAKKGFGLGQAKQFTGRLIVADISIPRELLT